MKRSLTSLSEGTIYRYLLSVSFFGAKTCILHPVSQYFQLRTFLLLNFTLSLSNLKKRVWQGFIDKSKWKKGLEAVVSTRLFRKSFAQSCLDPQSDLQTPEWTPLFDKAFNAFISWTFILSETLVFNQAFNSWSSFNLLSAVNLLINLPSTINWVPPICYNFRRWAKMSSAPRKGRFAPTGSLSGGLPLFHCEATPSNPEMFRWMLKCNC